MVVYCPHSVAALGVSIHHPSGLHDRDKERLVVGGCSTWCRGVLGQLSEKQHGLPGATGAVLTKLATTNSRASYGKSFSRSTIWGICSR